MLNRLSHAFFGASEQEGASSAAPEARGNAAGPPTQAKQDATFNTTEEEMGWLLVDVSRSSTPSLPAAQDEDGRLRRPDGTVFDGVLNLSSSQSSVGSEEAEGDVSASDSEDLEDHLSDCENVKGDSCHWEGSEDADIELLAELPSSSQCSYTSDSSGECLVDMSSSSCSSLSVISEVSGKENDLGRSAIPSPFAMSAVAKARRLALQKEKDRFMESWMMMPPPRFTGTEVNSPLKSSPFENYWIENSSVYATTLIRYGLIPGHMRALPCEVYTRMMSKFLEIQAAREQQAAEPQNRPSRVAEPSANAPFPSTGGCGLAEKRNVLGPVEMRKICVQQRQQATAARKFLSRSSLECSNKARMASSYSRKQVPARNRLLRPSGGKCGRFGQRSQ